jgi:hypothetical protein
LIQKKNIDKEQATTVLSCVGSTSRWHKPENRPKQQKMGDGQKKQKTCLTGRNKK